MRRTSHFFNDEQMDWIYRKWCEGYTQQQIADALFVNLATVNRSLVGKKKERIKLVAPPEIISPKEYR